MRLKQWRGVDKTLSAKVGMFIGRFQPFHKGHLHAIKFILNEVDKIIIVIGSAQCSHTFKNPFTTSERLEMIQAALNAEKINPERYMLIPVPDINDNRLWVDHVVTLVPTFNVVYTNDPLSTYLFKEKKYTVKNVPFVERTIYQGTFIRNRIASNEEWENLVPEAVKRIIFKINGVERIKTLKQY